MPGITYDAAALIAAERNDRWIWASHRRVLERGGVPTVPAGVLAQGWRGGPQAQMSRLLGADISSDIPVVSGREKSRSSPVRLRANS